MSVLRIVSVTALAVFATMLAAQEVPTTPSATVSTPAAGKGTVIFFRAKQFKGAAIVLKVHESEVELGRLSNGSFFVVQSTPGRHDYDIRPASKEVLTVEVKSAETYYVLGSMNETIVPIQAHPGLAVSGAATFEAMKEGLKDVTGQGRRPSVAQTPAR